MINIHNYEAHVLDYIAGDLPDATRIEMEIFLQNNKQICDEVKELKVLVLEADEKLIFSDKTKLLREQKTFRLPIKRWAQVAAAVLVLGVTIFAIYPTNVVTENRLATSEKTNPKTANSKVEITRQKDTFKTADSAIEIAKNSNQNNNQNTANQLVATNSLATKTIRNNTVGGDGIIANRTNGKGSNNTANVTDNVIENIADTNANNLQSSANNPVTEVVAVVEPVLRNPEAPIALLEDTQITDIYFDNAAVVSQNQLFLNTEIVASAVVSHRTKKQAIWRVLIPEITAEADKNDTSFAADAFRPSVFK